MNYYTVLENIRWHGKPQCPYCNATNVTKVLQEPRHHCNTCNTSFSVTVGTPLHGTRLEIVMWFKAVSLVLSSAGKISARQLAMQLCINKNTACRISHEIQVAMHDSQQRHLLLAIWQYMSSKTE